jgi:hypothetical protein
MKTIFGIFIRYSHIYLTVCVLLISGCRSSTANPQPDPLAGWRIDFNHQPAPSIMRDYQDYVRNLRPVGDKITSLGYFYENGTGQHALEFEVFDSGTSSWIYILIYDNQNKRIKAIKYQHKKYQS